MAKSEAKYYGTGRRKKSIARVYLVPGKGEITINKRNIDDYFGLETLKVIVRQPLAATDNVDKFDAIVTVKGGGYTGQAGAAFNCDDRIKLIYSIGSHKRLKKDNFKCL